MHEVLFGNVKDIATEYRHNFVGMTMEPVTLDTLLAAGADIEEIARMVTVQGGEELAAVQFRRRQHREFKVSAVHVRSEWRQRPLLNRQRMADARSFGPVPHGLA